MIVIKSVTNTKKKSYNKNNKINLRYRNKST